MFKQARRFFGKAYRAAKIFMNPGKAAIKLLSESVRDVGSKYPPQVQAIINECGESKIVDVKLCKEPISQNIELLLKVLAGPKTWGEAKRKYGFDRFYHLFMIITMDNGRKIQVEKNEVIRMSHDPRPCPDALDLGNPNAKLNDVLNRTKDRMGSKFYTYDAFNNNCQVFIAELLKSVNMYNKSASDFVFQDLQGLQQELPGYSKYIAKGLTTIGAIANTAYQKTKQYIDNGQAEGSGDQADAT